MKKLLALCVLGFLFLGWGASGVMGQAPQAPDWSTVGNAPLSNQYPFLGTNINYPLRMRVNGEHAGMVDFDGRTFLGSHAGDTLNPWPNTGFGAGVLSVSGGQHNSGLGLNALHLNTSGNANLAAGDGAMYSNLSGSNGTAVGAGALSGNISGNNNSAFGYNANVNSGNLTNATAVGANAVVSQSNSLVLGDNNAQVGIGTSAPVAKLDIHGQIKITDGTEGVGKVLMSDANGLASWDSPQPINAWNTNGNGNIVNGTHFLGTTNNAPLDVRVNNQPAGTINFNGTTFLGSLAGQFAAPGNTGFGHGVLQNSSGIGNTGMGQSALRSNGSGYWNTATGDSALYSNTTGYGNTAAGYISMKSNTSGWGNTGLGGAALYRNTTGKWNTAVGGGALYLNVTGEENSALGFLSLFQNTQGYSNTASGAYSLNRNTIGYQNTAIGARSLEQNQGGFNNTALGAESMQSNLSGAGNTSIGMQSLRANQTGQENTAVGGAAMLFNVAGNKNTAVGVNALMSTKSNMGTSIGYGALQNNTTGAANTAIGSGALFLNTIAGNLVAIGDSALYNNGVGANNTQALQNTAVGSNAMFANTTGSFCTAVGHGALKSNTWAIGNTAIGCDALSNGGGWLNTATGYRSLYGNGGIGNTATGGYALRDNKGNSNTAFGVNALSSNSTGNSNSAVGVASLGYNTSGVRNAALGEEALFNNTSGGNNTALGWRALYRNVTGSRNTAIGDQAFPYGTGYTNSTALGYLAHVTASNQIVLGNNAITNLACKVNLSVWSDARIKEQVQENVPGLEFINQLRPVTYHYNMDREYEIRGIIDSAEYDGKYAVERIQFTGFIAQEVERAAAKVGYDFSGVDRPKNDSGVYALRYAEFVVPLVKATQELSAQNKAQLAEIKSQKETITELSARLNKLEAIVNGCCNIATDKASTAVAPADQNRLDQNAPNPFQENTVISYYVAEQSPNTYIRIITLEGHEIARYPITDKGEGQITITGNTLTGSLYLYELIVDDLLVASRKMVLTR